MKKLLALGAATVLFAGCSTTTTTTVEPTATPEAMTQSDYNATPVASPMMSPEASPSPEAKIKVATTLPDGSMKVTLDMQNDSNQSGTATLTSTKDGKTTVVLALTGGNFTAAQPAHIHEGSCPTPGTVKYPLTNVVNGKSTTTLNVSMEELLKAAPRLSVNVHKSAADVNSYTACGNIQ